jgi:HAD superfamily hydrolase (TIGR01490 family)
MRLAIFDLDGTLIHASSERLFARYLYERRVLGWRQVAGFVAFLVRYAAHYDRTVFKRDKAYLSGLSKVQIDELARSFVDERLLGTVYRPALARLERHRGASDLVVLLTGTPDFIAAPLGERLGLQHVIATECAIEEGRFTGAPPRQHPLGRDKLRYAQAFAAQHGVPLADAVAYANARDDRFLLAQVGEAVAVRPDVHLRGLARRAGWEIIEART